MADALPQVSNGNRRAARGVQKPGRLRGKRVGGAGVSSPLQPPNLRKSVGEMVGEMCPHTAPATDFLKDPANRRVFLLSQAWGRFGPATGAPRVAQGALRLLAPQQGVE